MSQVRSWFDVEGGAANCDAVSRGKGGVGEAANDDSLIPFFHWCILAAHEPAILPHVFRLRPVELRLLLGFSKLFFDNMAAPSRDPGDGEDRGHEIPGNPHHVIHGCTVEVDIGLNLGFSSSPEFVKPSLLDLG